MCGRHSARPVVGLNVAMTMSKFEAEMGGNVSSSAGLSTNVIKVSSCHIRCTTKSHGNM